ncbi:GumC family protein [Gloeobacter kilaueensis]|uniref:Cryptic autophosphorylating protein tyrosine kinase Etk n=1 Tax=Gloeobacter kilaueensis (strain ATCC BAA-2537 / CCAP 1431/1 / ULC 316 / JS1) TaxID=1183438 RepID=U5QCC3_GLOK1|nr:GNVR domain-containing protein [Gloeobacter kilaueensis]AGY56516.1 cryptic autophosphorylating protein tyrosine kinase Etk [Gloeobacter kilaueensis JS1]
MSTLAIARRHLRPLLILNGAILTTAIGIALFFPKSWTATTQLILPDTSSNLSASLGPLGNLQQQGLTFSTELSPTTIQSNILLSDSVLRRVWLKDPEKQEKFPRLEDYTKLFKSKIEDQSTIVQVQVKGSSPEIAKNRANALLQSYQRRLNELRLDDARRRDQFSHEELERAKRTLQQTQSELASYQQTTGLVNVDEQTRGLVETLNTLRSSATLAQAQAKAAEDRSRSLEQAVGMDLRRATSALRVGEDKEYQSLRQKLTDIETQLAQARGIYTEKNQRIQSLLLQREELLSKIKLQLSKLVPDSEKVDTTLGGNTYRDSRIDLILQLIQARSEGLAQNSQANQITEKIDSIDSQLRTMAPQQSKLLELNRRYGIAEGVYKAMLAQVQQAKINAFDTYPNVQVLDPPAVDPKPSPRLFLIVLGALLAMIAGSVALALLLERRNPLLAKRDIEVTGLPVLARLPKFKDNELIATAEEFLQLASIVSLMPLEGQRLMITSSTFGEGKTTVTLGLARALRSLGFRVLVVDADFRQAGLGRLLQVNQGNEPVALAPSLNFLPAGQPDGDASIGEHIVKGNFTRHLDRLKQENGHDYILIDTAPEQLVAETKLIAAEIRNVLFVVRPGTSDRDMVNSSLETLKRCGANINIVINSSESPKDAYAYRYGRSSQSV